MKIDVLSPVTGTDRHTDPQKTLRLLADQVERYGIEYVRETLVVRSENLMAVPDE